MESIPSDLAPEMHMVYYPQIGCQIAYPLQENVSLESQVDIPGLSYQVRRLILRLIQFHTSNKIYFKNARTHELDEYLGDIHNDIVDMEGKLLSPSQQSVHHSSIRKCN